jgi:hypothetical protein
MIGNLRLSSTLSVKLGASSNKEEIETVEKIRGVELS